VIFHKDQYLIFITKIPLIHNNDVNVYNLIPLPVVYDSKSLILVEPEIEILALSYDKEKFFSMTNKQWEMCRKLKSYTLCKSSQPIHHRSKSNLCELALLLNPQNLPDNCKIKFVTANLAVWNQIADSNSWIFYTQSEIITINCENPKRTFTFEIYGVGRLTISPSCIVHTDRSILLPSIHVIANTYDDIIPENSKFNVKHSFADRLNLLLPQNITNVQVINDLNTFTQNLKELNNLEKRPTEPPLIIMVNIHITVMYISIICFAIICTLLVFKLNRSNVKLYKPDLAETELSEN